MYRCITQRQILVNIVEINLPSGQWTLMRVDLYCQAGRIVTTDLNMGQVALANWLDSEETP